MSFGFDSSIILSGMPRPPPESSINDTLQTLASLASHRTQQQQGQAQLADMLRRQGQEKTLADIYRSNANSPQAVAPALMQAGLGDAALNWMGRQSEIGSRQATSQRMASSLYEAGLQRLRGRASAVKTDEQYQQLIAPIPAEERAQLGLPDQFDPAALEGFIAGGARPGMLLSPEQEEAMLARATKERAQAAKLRQGPAPVNPDKQEADALKREAQRLKNEEMRRKQAAAGEPDPLLQIEGYAPRKGFKVKPEVAEKLRGAQADTETMKEGLDELMALYRKHGNEVLPGAIRGRMSSLATHLQLTAKGPTQFGLGVIAGPDMDLLNAVITNPTKKEATLADFFGGGTELSESMTRLRVMREQIDKKLHNAIMKRGYDPMKKKGGGATASPTPAADTWADTDEARLQELERKAGGGLAL